MRDLLDKQLCIGDNVLVVAITSELFGYLLTATTFENEKLFIAKDKNEKEYYLFNTEVLLVEDRDFVGNSLFKFSIDFKKSDTPDYFTIKVGDYQFRYNDAPNRDFDYLKIARVMGRTQIEYKLVVVVERVEHIGVDDERIIKKLDYTFGLAPFKTFKTEDEVETFMEEINDYYLT